MRAAHISIQFSADPAPVLIICPCLKCGNIAIAVKRVVLCSARHGDGARPNLIGATVTAIATGTQ
jgi:hypothetical protein